MKRTIFILFAILSMISSNLSIHAQSNSLNGAWTLENIKLFVKKENNSYNQINYSASVSLNSSRQFYPALTFNDNTCEVQTNDSNKFSGKFMLENNQLELYLTPLTDKFDVEWNGNNSITFSRLYSDFDSANTSQMNDYKVILTYKRK